MVYLNDFQLTCRYFALQYPFKIGRNKRRGDPWNKMKFYHHNGRSFGSCHYPYSPKMNFFFFPFIFLLCFFSIFKLFQSDEPRTSKLVGGLLELIKRALYDTGFVKVKTRSALKVEAAVVYFINPNERQQSHPCYPTKQINVRWPGFDDKIAWATVR